MAIFFNVEIDRTVLLVSETSIDDFLYHRDLFDDMPGSMRFDTGIQQVQLCHQFMVAVGIILDHFHRFNLFEPGLFADLIITCIGISFKVPDISYVTHIADLIPDMLQVAENQVESDGGAGVAQVRITVYRRSANIQSNMKGCKGHKKFLLACKTVVNQELLLHRIADLMAKVSNLSIFINRAGYFWVKSAINKY